jgi:DNA-binding protein YbaB
VDNDAARHELVEALALVQEHMADLALVQTKRAGLSATATAAGGTVVITVNAQGIVSNTVVDESYLDDYALADLGNYVTAAAQAAAGDVQRQSAELLAPLAERRERFPSLSDVVNGAPDIRDLVSQFHPVGQARLSASDGDHDAEAAGNYPTVRSK